MAFLPNAFISSPMGRLLEDGDDAQTYPLIVSSLKRCPSPTCCCNEKATQRGKKRTHPSFLNAPGCACECCGQPEHHERRRVRWLVSKHVLLDEQPVRYCSECGFVPPATAEVGTCPIHDRPLSKGSAAIFRGALDLDAGMEDEEGNAIGMEGWIPDPRRIVSDEERIVQGMDQSDRVRDFYPTRMKASTSDAQDAHMKGDVISREAALHRVFVLLSLSAATSVQDVLAVSRDPARLPHGWQEEFLAAFRAELDPDQDLTLVAQLRRAVCRALQIPSPPPTAVDYLERMWRTAGSEMFEPEPPAQSPSGNEHNLSTGCNGEVIEKSWVEVEVAYREGDDKMRDVALGRLVVFLLALVRVLSITRALGALKDPPDLPDGWKKEFEESLLDETERKPALRFIEYVRERVCQQLQVPVPHPVSATNFGKIKSELKSQYLARLSSSGAAV